MLRTSLLPIISASTSTPNTFAMPNVAMARPAPTYELKRHLNRGLALLGPEKDNGDRKRKVGEKHHLQVVNGKIPVPDLRIEYENPELELRHVDLELATRDYRPRAIAEKASAGFSLYGRSEDASRLRRVLDEREITAGILTL